MITIRTKRRKYYDVFSHFYDLFIRLHSYKNSQETRAFLVDSAGLEHVKQPKVLDVCCGTGSVTLTFTERFPGIFAVGYDFSHGMLYKAREKDVNHTCFLVEGDAAILPFGDDYFDVVCCSHALYELKGDSRKAALFEMKRVIKPDGAVLIMEHEVPKNFVIKILFNLRMMMMGRTDAREFVKLGLAPYKKVFPDVILTHTKSGTSKLMTCRKE
ncbi:methyltransferase domain-containing protein [candidate division KSB1 bacterium]|nr:methyltransferase domain-containing protein [candidate division KSB1 bacterium]